MQLKSVYSSSTKYDICQWVELEFCHRICNMWGPLPELQTPTKIQSTGPEKFNLETSQD